MEGVIGVGCAPKVGGAFVGNTGVGGVADGVTTGVGGRVAGWKHPWTRLTAPGPASVTKKLDTLLRLTGILCTELRPSPMISNLVAFPSS